MLREKEELIGQLQAAVLEHLTAQSSWRFEHWKQRQDQTLERMRQVCVFLSVCSCVVMSVCLCVFLYLCLCLCEVV